MRRFSYLYKGCMTLINKRRRDIYSPFRPTIPKLLGCPSSMTLSCLRSNFPSYLFENEVMNKFSLRNIFSNSIKINKSETFLVNFVALSRKFKRQWPSESVTKSGNPPLNLVIQILISIQCRSFQNCDNVSPSKIIL